jgi:hypothetical protein
MRVSILARLFAFRFGLPLMLDEFLKYGIGNFANNRQPPRVLSALLCHFIEQITMANNDGHFVEQIMRRHTGWLVKVLALSAFSDHPFSPFPKY